MNALLIALAFAASPHVEPETVSVSLIEVNRLYDENGVLTLTQLIVWDWDESAGRMQVREWRPVKDGTPMPKRVGSGYETAWNTGPMRRVVRSAEYRETWTQYGPETCERTVLPMEQRRRLFPDPEPTPAIR